MCDSAAILPPGSHNNPTSHILSLQLTHLLLMEPSHQSAHLKLSMWGLPDMCRLHHQGRLLFEVRTSTQLFGCYMRDMRVSRVSMCDGRNGAELGTGVVNWLLFMKKGLEATHDSPFVDDEFEFVMPICNYRKRQIAEAKIRVSFTAVGVLGGGSQASEEMHSIRNLEQHAVVDAVRMSPAHASRKTYKQLLGPSRKMVSIVDQGNLYYDENQLKHARKQSKLSLVQNMKKRTLQSELQIIAASDDRDEEGKEVRYPNSKYQIEKARLKMETEQLLTLTKKQPLPPATKKDTTTVWIGDLHPIKSSAHVQYMDVIVHSGVGGTKHKSSDRKQKSGDRKHVRVFPNNKEMGSLAATVVAEWPQVITIELAGNLGRASVEVRQVMEQRTVRLTLQGNGKFGTVTLTALPTQPSSHPECSPPNPLINKVQPQPTTSPPAIFLLTIIRQCQHPHLNVAPFIKCHPFQPLPCTNIIPLVELGTLFALQLRNEEGETVDSATVTDFRVESVEASLGCVVLRDGWVKVGAGRVRLWMGVGTLRQVNYQMARQGRQSGQAQKSAQVQVRNKARTESSQNRQSEQPGEYQAQNLSRQRPNKQSKVLAQPEYQVSESGSQNSLQARPQKLYTQAPHLYTEPLSQDKPSHHNNRSQHNMNLHSHANMNRNANTNINVDESNQNETIHFAAETLCRVFHALPVQKLSDTAPPTVVEFSGLLGHFLEGRPEKELIQTVAEMFVNEEEGTTGRLEYEQFLNCVRAFHNFLQLWWSQKCRVLSRIRELQPDCTVRISKYSELDMISRDFLWRKALNKVSDPNLQLQVDKLYNLSAGSALYSPTLLQDLSQARLSPTTPPPDTTIDMILDLGRLIKSTIQSLLQSSGIDAMAIQEDILNIKTLCIVFQQMNIKLSYWESLMLIEQLKGWYNIDTDLNEGLISGSTVEVWLKTVLNRSLLSSKSGRSGLSDPQELPQPPRQQPQQQQMQADKPLQMPPHSMKHSQKLLQNKSVVRSQLNQEQIFNIANLLRENDNFHMGTLSSEKPMPDHIGTHPNMNMILDDDLLMKSEQASSLLDPQPHPQPRRESRWLWGKVKSIKLKHQPEGALKLVIAVNGFSSDYYLCNSIKQAEGVPFVHELPHNWQHSSKGLQFMFHKITPSAETQVYQQVPQEHGCLMQGFLLADQIHQLLAQSTKNKTIVLYTGMQIVGKLTIEVSVGGAKPQQAPTMDRKRQVYLTIEESTSGHQPQGTEYTVKVVNMLSPVDDKQTGSGTVVDEGEETAIEMPELFYRYTLVVEARCISGGLCSVPLEELYLRPHIRGEYPIIDSEGLYQGSLQITLRNPERLPGNIMESSLHAVAGDASLAVPARMSALAPSQQYLVIFDSLACLKPRPQAGSPSILARILVRDALDRRVLYRSPFQLQHPHPQIALYSCLWIHTHVHPHPNHCLIPAHSPQVTIQLEYSGRYIGIGVGVVELGAGRCAQVVELRYSGIEEVRLSMQARVLAVSGEYSKYKMERVYGVLAGYRAEPGQENVEGLPGSEKLTRTEQRILREIISQNTSINESSSDYMNVGYPLDRQQHQQLVRQLVACDPGFTGRAALPDTLEIISSIAGEQMAQQIVGKFMAQYYGGQQMQTIDYLSLLCFTDGLEPTQGTPLSTQIDNLHSQIMSKYMKC